MLRKVDRVIFVVEASIVFILLISLVFISFAQIILRNFFASGFPWADEFTRHQVLWLGLLGMSLASSEARHINIDILSRFLRGKSARAMGFIKFTFASFVCGVLTYASSRFIWIESQPPVQVSVGLKVPIWYLEMLFPVGFGLSSLRFFLRAFEELLGKVKYEEVKPI